MNALHELPALRIAPDLHPGYRLCRKLGRGGFGEVWEARTEEGQAVALKFLPYNQELTAVQELRSIQLVCRLRHRHLIDIKKVWCSSGYMVVVMPLADGSLFDLLAAYQEALGSPIPAGELCSLLAQAAEAIDFLNARQHLVDGRQVAIQHCDINPGNLLIFGDTVKVSDFSLTSLLTSTEKPHRRAGTLEYAAPEVFQGRLSCRTDQYALAISYCLLRGGRLPFRDTPESFRSNHVRARPDLTMLGPAERPIVAQALAASPLDRWPSCRELIAQLARALSPHPSSCPGQSAAERRAAGRYPPSPETTCRLLVTRGIDSGPARILDLSATGMKLVVPQLACPLPADRQLSLVLANKASAFGRVVRLLVTHHARSANDEHVLGGNFSIRLGNDELKALVQDLPT